MPGVDHLLNDRAAYTRTLMLSFKSSCTVAQRRELRPLDVIRFMYLAGVPVDVARDYIRTACKSLK
jgi:hypothetical protein